MSRLRRALLVTVALSASSLGPSAPAAHVVQLSVGGGRRREERAVTPALRAHWPEYLIEAAALAVFMISDAAFYVAAQFLGAVVGVAVSSALLGARLSHPSIRFVATIPGPSGQLAAFLAEVAISFVLMSVVLSVSSSRFQRLTGVCAGLLVALYVTVEAPISGMSMNPARSLGSAVFAGAYAPLWIDFLAPPIGMLLAAGLLPAGAKRGCAKLDHPPDRPCIFCGQRLR